MEYIRYCLEQLYGSMHAIAAVKHSLCNYQGLREFSKCDRDNAADVHFIFNLILHVFSLSVYSFILRIIKLANVDA